MRSPKTKHGNRIGYLIWHFTVDDKEVIQHMPLNEAGEHADHDGPGHHAGPARAEGFCFLNHAALAITRLRQTLPDAKVAVVDRRWATVGSSNLDPLSLMLAREASAMGRCSGVTKTAVL